MREQFAEIHRILFGLEQRMNWRAYSAALALESVMSARKWKRLRRSREKRLPLPTLGYRQGALALACADIQLSLAGSVVRLDTPFRDVLGIVKERTPHNVEKLARGAGLSSRSLQYYQDGREPSFLNALRIAEQVPDGIQLRTVRDWYFAFCVPQPTGLGPYPLGQEPHLWGAIVSRKLAGETSEQLAAAFKTTPEEIERICEWVASCCPEMLGTILRPRSRPRGPKPRKPKKRDS